MSRATRRFTSASPEALFVVSGIFQYTGASVAIHLFHELPPATVAMFRVLFGALPVLALSWRAQRKWTRSDLVAAAVFGIATALMNVCFYLGIARLPLGKSVMIEFIGPIALAAYHTRNRRNAAALALAVAGVVILGGVEIGGNFVGVLYILGASAMWATYLVLGRRVAHLDRGLSGLGVGLVIGGFAVLPFGYHHALDVLTSGRLLALCALVGVFSSSIGYGIDQVVMQRIPMRRVALLLALLPVTAMVMGFIALGQVPTFADYLGAALVIAGVLTQERDELPAPADALSG